MQPLNSYLIHIHQARVAPAIWHNDAKPYLLRIEFRTFFPSSLADHSTTLSSLRSLLTQLTCSHANPRLRACTCLFCQHYTDTLTYYQQCSASLTTHERWIANAPYQCAKRSPWVFPGFSSSTHTVSPSLSDFVQLSSQHKYEVIAKDQRYSPSTISSARRSSYRYTNIYRHKVLSPIRKFPCCTHRNHLLLCSCDCSSMAGPGGGPPRKSHTKSRKGCRMCKKRHIRCDENFPQWCAMTM